MSVFYSEVNFQLCTPEILEEHFLSADYYFCVAFFFLIKNVFNYSYPVIMWIQSHVWGWLYISSQEPHLQEVLKW